VILLHRIGEVLRLALVTPVSPAPPPPSVRFPVDRALADRAEVIAVRGLHLPAGSCAVSRSHTRGLAAALAAPAPARLGVDVVPLDRVTRRHAAAVAGPAERKTLAPWEPLAGALAWALKEAAAKATGDPAHSFPDGLRIVGLPSGLGVCWPAGSGLVFRAGWLRLGDFLCAWVRA
jgi:hypothetical protein